MFFPVKNDITSTTMQTMFRFTFLAYTIHTFLDLVNVECTILVVVIGISSMDMGKTMENMCCFKVEFHMHHILSSMLSFLLYRLCCTISPLLCDPSMETIHKFPQYKISHLHFKPLIGVNIISSKCGPSYTNL